jgi:formate dehydrogenase iron-sulfur subunit
MMNTQISVFVPRETSAASMGAEKVAEAVAAIAARPGDALRLVRNGSWGACWLEPLLEISDGDQRIAYANVTADDVAGIIESHRNGENHAKRLGPTIDIPYLIQQDRWTFHRCGLIEALSLEDFERRGGWAGLRKAFETGSRETIEQVKLSGLRGRGGAGFPTGIKWQTVADAKADQKYIACNADEGDSGTFSDRMLMEGDPYTLIEGMAIAGFAVGATRGVIYLRSEYPLARRILGEALSNARQNGWLGENIQGSGFSFDIELHIGGGSYVCGEETAMLESLEGKQGLVRYKPPLPALEGLFGKPTVVNNVVSLGSVPNILRLGGERYAALGVGRSKGTLAFQLGGNVKRGGLVEKAFGVTLRELIEDWGGGTASGRPVRAVQVGGPLGAYLPADKLDTPLDYEQFAAAGGMIGHGGIVVFDDTVDMAVQARFAMEFCALESCGKCTPCRIGSVRGVELIDRIRAGEAREQNLQTLNDLCDTMIHGSLCAMGGMTPFPVRSAVQYFPQDFESAGESNS